MKTSQGQPADAIKLRRRAEVRLKRQKLESGGEWTEVEMARLVHELEVHQIELEMQNEELRQAHAQLEALHAEERLQASAQVKALLAQYTDLYDFAPMGYFNLDREGTIRRVNLTGAYLLGVERSRLMNRRLGLFVAEGDRRSFSDFLQNVFANKAKECFEVTLPQEGSQPLVVRIEGLRSADGQECRAIVLDITKRKRAEEKIRETENKYRSIVENSDDQIFMLDKDCKFLSINKTAADFSRKSTQEMIGKSLFEIFPETTAARFSKNVKKVFETGKSLSIDEKMIVQGREYYNSSRLNPVKDDRGRVIAVAGIVRDITEHKRAEEQIKKSLREKDILLKEIHHRVKNNLQIICSLLNLQVKIEKNKKVRDILEESKNRIRSMAIIHEKLYQSGDFSRINLTEYIPSLTTHLFHAYRIDSGRVELKMNMKDVFLSLDLAVPCGLLINELVANALKHAFPDTADEPDVRKGIIEVSISSKDNIYTLIVRDNGIGLIEKVDLSKPVTLGMVLINALVIQLDAIMEVKRNNGTTFKFTFTESADQKRKSF
jgi:PAS domain S-box-containing protein